MERKNPMLFFEACRLCLDRPGVCRIFEIPDMPVLIEYVFGVTVSLSDNLPEKICKECVDIVKNTKELRKTAKKNDFYLRTLFNSDSDRESTQDMNDFDEDGYISKLVIIESDDEQDNLQLSNDTSKENTPIQQSIPTVSVRTDLFSTRPEPITSEEISSNCMKRKSENLKSELVDLPKSKIKKSTSVQTEWKCSECSKVFDKAKKLYLHMRFHKKNMHCPLDCGKVFATRGDLQKHVRTHTGEKPFKCTLCDRSFAQKASLKLHKENVHKNKERETIDKREKILLEPR